ncbi:ribonuclease R [Ereboglobus sp. PH5-10]|uniref:ribonuclease R family protein n=1 Tax=Ereboglobus sp. PH5-10 TaxID=2940629 RepID=UPI0024055AE0|nr:RNB domain-containing ribonuclease [Ereboglobus sp. PH5-10]MDF9827453.1 ribonuclease R [Ereboglobus sp. PH5-10]
MKLRDRILAHLRQRHYRPQDIKALGHSLALNKKERNSLKFEIRQLLSKGGIVHVQGDRLALAGEDDTRTGKIMFRQGGSAFVILDPLPGRAGANAIDEPAIQIAPEDTGVALHGDKVLVKISPRMSRARNGRPPEPQGRVASIVERASNTVVGNLVRIRNKFYVNVDDPRFVQDIAVGDPAASRIKPVPGPGDKVVVALSEWTARHKPLEGKITQCLGKTFEPGAELAGILIKHHLDPKFPADVEREVAALPSEVVATQLPGRLDYRDTPTFTIDPDDAKDFDDALSIETLDNDETRVGIHIADVSNYVRPGTALDREARGRGNSTYLVGTVIPMLPQKLSNGLCSLVEGQDRLCKAVFLTFDKKLRVTNTTFASTVIRSRKRLTYKQAYAFMFENSIAKIRALPVPPAHQTGSTGRALKELTDLELVDLQHWLRSLWKIAAKLRRERMARGSLDLDMPETKIFVDEKGYADRLERIENDESHQLIEEFMLAANEAVARLTRAHKLVSLYRVHDEPDEDKLIEYQKVLATAGVEAGDLTQRKEIVKVLAALEKHPQGYVLRSQLLRSLKKACYRATPDGHYGLAKKDYTHFTSPIRRYSDLVVHRVLAYYLIKHAGHPVPADYKFGYSAGSMASLGEHLSLTETNSAEAERESVKIKTLEFFERELSKKKKTKFDAVITDVRGAGIFIELTESMSFGFINKDSFTGDIYFPNAGNTAFVGRKTKKHLKVGEHITVVVKKVDRTKRQMDFAMA